MTLALPFISMSSFDLSQPPNSADTIHVTSSYTVDVGDTLDLAGSPGFKLEVKSGTSITLDINGSVSLDGGADHRKVAGVLTSRSVYGDAQVTIGAAGSLSVDTQSDGGQAVGVILQTNNAAFANYGTLHVSALHGVAAGALAQGASGVAMTNNGSIDVEALGIAYGMYGVGATGSATNNGTITCSATQAAGLIFVGTAASVVNNDTVKVFGIHTGPGGFAVGAAIGSGAFTNNDLIFASGKSYALGAEVINATIVNNNGHLIGLSANGAQQSVGLLFATDVGGGTITNNGLIRGDLALVAADAFVVGGGGGGPVSNDVVINTGKLDGDVLMGGGSDGISNNGRITGDVDMGAGGDIFISNRGRVDGVVTGGLGNDNITGSHAGDILYGDGLADAVGDGNDELRGMKGADQLFGGQGADTLTGGIGADTLAGGAGDDVFRFTKLVDSSKGAVDLITDLTATDKVDISAIDAQSGTGGDQAFHLVASFSGAQGELTVSYDSGTGLTTIAGDIDGDGTADLTITASGDHSGFTNFVL